MEAKGHNAKSQILVLFPGVLLCNTPKHFVPADSVHQVNEHKQPL